MKRKILAVLLVAIMVIGCGCASGENTVVEIDSYVEFDSASDPDNKGGSQYYLAEDTVYDPQGNTISAAKYDYEFDEYGRVLFEYIWVGRDLSDLKGEYYIKYDYFYDETGKEIEHHEYYDGELLTRVEYEYDDNGRLFRKYFYEMFDSKKNKISFSLGDNGIVATVLEYEYDESGNVIRELQYDLEYDEYDIPYHTVNYTTEIENDSIGRAIKENVYLKDGTLGWVEMFEYDKHGNLSKVIRKDFEGEITSYTENKYKKMQTGYTPISDSYEDANVSGNDEDGRRYYYYPNEEKPYDAQTVFQEKEQYFKESNMLNEDGYIEYDGLLYHLILTYYDSTGMITGLNVVGSLNENASQIIIPAEIEGVPVININESAFSDFTLLNDITIPSSVISIDGGAFYKCTSLESIVIPEGVKEIGPVAFADCDALERVYLPDSIEEIDMHCFDGSGRAQIYCNPGTYAWEFADENLMLAE